MDFLALFWCGSRGRVCVLFLTQLLCFLRAVGLLFEVEGVEEKACSHTHLEGLCDLVQWGGGGLGHRLISEESETGFNGLRLPFCLVSANSTFGTYHRVMCYDQGFAGVSHQTGAREDGSLVWGGGYRVMGWSLEY